MSDRSIRDAINQIAGTHLADKVYTVDATVTAVNMTERTCTCEIINGHVQNIITVRLMASVDDGFLIQPEIESTVSVILSDFGEPYISQYSGIDKITFRGGDLGGLVKVAELTEKINNLENALNALFLKFNAHTHNVISVGAPSGPSILQETNNLVPTQRNEIENINITHG